MRTRRSRTTRSSCSRAELKREVTSSTHPTRSPSSKSFDDAEETLEDRPPVVTIMGHVDHGKTTLLDAIRETAVVATEAGGSPSTSAPTRRPFTAAASPSSTRRATRRSPRCAPAARRSTDIAVLVVAADDGVMPQTRESISHARAAEVPIVVAVNKVDLPDANTDRVLGELANEGCSRRSGRRRRRSRASRRSRRKASTTCSSGSCSSPTPS